MSSITLIGAGHLATHLALSLRKAGHIITQVFSKSKESAHILSNRLNCSYTTDIKSIITSDLAIIAIKDDAIEEIERFVSFPKVHTSGSKHINCLNGENIGVIYPVQSFSKDSEMDLSQVPICIEANNPILLAKIKGLAHSISDRVLLMDSQQRAYLHLSAVIACNFSNLMYIISEEICSDYNIPFELLHPLITESAKKIQKMTPSQALTGPAKRGDISVLKQHANLLLTDKEKKEIYQLLSNSITNRKL